MLVAALAVLADAIIITGLGRSVQTLGRNVGGAAAVLPTAVCRWCSGQRGTLQVAGGSGGCASCVSFLSAGPVETRKLPNINNCGNGLIDIGDTAMTETRSR